MKLLVLATFCAVAAAQTPTFEAASIKPTAIPGGNSSMKLTQGRLTMENVSLRKLILRAWGIPDDRTYAIAGPAFLETDSFDIQATFGPATGLPEILKMTQTLLQERFHLKLHLENRQFPLYTLLPAKGGILLTPAEAGQGRTSSSPGRLQASGITMEKLTDLLSRQAGLPVIDGTGLRGAFDFTLTWAPSEGITPSDPAAISSEAAGPSLFTALREQLGLRIESGRGAVQILVVDYIEKRPTAN